MKHTAETIYALIVKNAGISYEEITKDFEPKNFLEFGEVIKELVLEKRVVIVHFYSSPNQEKNTIRYFPTPKGALRVLAEENGFREIFSYDPHDIVKKVVS